MGEPSNSFHNSVSGISCLVIEINGTILTIGYSGDEQPKMTISSIVGSKDVDLKENLLFGDLELTSSSCKSYYPCISWGVSENVPHCTLEIKIFHRLLQHCLKRLCIEAKSIPCLFIVPFYLDENSRKNLISTSLELIGFPAVQVVYSPICASFGAGRYTALVLDLNMDYASIVPVHEGNIISQAAKIITSPLCLDFFKKDFNEYKSDFIITGYDLRIYCFKMIQALGIPEEFWIYPTSLVQKKEHVELAENPKFSLKNNFATYSEANKTFQQTKLLDEIRESVCQISEMRFAEKELSLRPPIYFEFPSGYNLNFGVERFKFGELVFSGAGQNSKGIIQLINDVLQSVDIELRNSLISNLVLLGPITLINGFVDRLSYELNQSPVFGKIRIYLNNTPGQAASLERKYLSWIGGSILASLKSLSSAWITKSSPQ